MNINFKQFFTFELGKIKELLYLSYCLKLMKF